MIGLSQLVTDWLRAEARHDWRPVADLAVAERIAQAIEAERDRLRAQVEALRLDDYGQGESDYNAAVDRVLALLEGVSE